MQCKVMRGGGRNHNKLVQPTPGVDHNKPVYTVVVLYACGDTRHAFESNCIRTAMAMLGPVCHKLRAKNARVYLNIPGYGDFYVKPTGKLTGLIR